MESKKRRLSTLRIRQMKATLHRHHKTATQKAETLSYGDIINIVVAVFTLLSVIGVFWTILEMRRDRDAAYRPAIVMNPIEISFSWNEGDNRDSDWLKTKLSSRFSVVNIGVGTAKNVVFEWDEHNTAKLRNYLIMCDSSKADFCTIGEYYDSFSLNGVSDSAIMSKEGETSLMYILPEANETHQLLFPIQYSILIEEIIKTGYSLSIPRLTLYAKYEDIQGKKIKSTYSIIVDVSLHTTDTLTSGEAIYQLVPQTVY